MEEFFSFIVVLIGAIVAIVNSSNKKKQQAQKSPYASASVSTAAPKQAAAPAPAEQVSMSAMLPQREEPQTAQPTVHTHLDPDCDVHDKSGSLNFKSAEGKDPCHEEQLPGTREPLPETAAQPGLSLDWTGDGLVKAFVMQEVLTRPSQRRAR